MKRALALLVMIVFALGLSGCTVGQQLFVEGWMKEWAFEHAGDIAGRQFGVPSSDNGVNAVLDGVDTVKAIAEADDKMEKARTTRDAAAMDEVLKKYPNFGSYLISRSALALEQGDLDKADSLSTKASKVSTPGRVYDLAEQEMQEVQLVADRVGGSGLTSPKYKSRAQCEAIYDTLLTDAEVLTSDHRAPSQDIQAGWRSERKNCATLFPDGRRPADQSMNGVITSIARSTSDSVL